MKIWLDLRLLNNNLYSDFIIDIINTIIKLNIREEPLKKYNLYINNLDIKSSFDCINIKKIWAENWSFKEQTFFLNILKKDNNDLMIFFDHHKPIFYYWEYYTIINSLKDVYYQNFNNSFSKLKYLYLLKKNLKNSSKIICFDSNSKDEFIEMLNIEEKKINILSPFFINKSILLTDEFKIDVRTKYNIKNNFLIYSWGDWIEKNVDRLINALFRLNKENNIKIDLVILWEEISKNINLRNLIIYKKLQNNIHFLWGLKINEKLFIYENSLWVIFPSLYESFPFKLSEPLFLNKPLIVSNLENIKNILWNNAHYFSPISTSSMVNAINKFIIKWNKTIDYSDVIKKYNKLASAQKLLEIIN